MDRRALHQAVWALDVAWYGARVAGNDVSDDRAAGGPPSARPVLPGSGFPPPLMAGLLGIECPHERRRTMRELMHQLGFDRIALARCALVDGAFEPRTLGSESGTDEWPARYLAERHFEVDPRLRTLVGSSLPCLWDLESLEADASRAFDPVRARAFTEGLAATGMRSGVMFGLRGALPHAAVLVSFLSARSGHEWISDNTVGQAFLIAAYVGAQPHAASVLARDTERDEGPLSGVQGQILQCVVEGLSDKLIADRLSLSPHNVDYHLRRLRRRFGVRNRVQLVQAASAMPAPASVAMPAPPSMASPTPFSDRPAAAP